jgi:hypothetical protein
MGGVARAVTDTCRRVGAGPPCGPPWYRSGALAVIGKQGEWSACCSGPPVGGAANQGVDVWFTLMVNRP